MKLYVARYDNAYGYRDWSYVLAKTIHDADMTVRSWNPNIINVTIEERDYHSAVINACGSTAFNSNYERIR